MAHTNVSSCVLSIAGSFSSGLDVFKKLREKRKRRRPNRRDGRKGDAIVEEEEMRLSSSLRQGPEDVGRAYARSLYAVGDGFAVGDAPAQASLAEVLLKLNTGIVGILSSFPNTDKRDDVQPDYQALTQLSDRSRIDTCRALHQLFKRMVQPRLPPAMAALDGQRQRPASPRRKRKASSKVKGPVLARVTIENSSKPSQIAMVKLSERRKKSSFSSSSELSKASSTPSTPPPEYAPEPPPRPVAVRAKTAPDVPKTARAQASFTQAPPPVVPSDVRQAARSTSRLPTMAKCNSSLPIQPHLAPLQHTHVNPAAQSTPALANRARTRKPTPTNYSIASDSTRLGEIPLHKWHVPYDFDQMSILNREAERKGWPANDSGAEEVEGKRRGWGLGRLFKGKK